ERFEQAGVVVRLPDWWSARRRRRPTVSVTIGEERPSLLGLGAMLDFDVKVTLGGEPLTPAEIEALLSASTGLLWMKGQWVEVDRERLGQVLDHWRQIEATAGAGGVQLGDAMRMLAGADPEADPDADAARPDWSTVI